MNEQALRVLIVEDEESVRIPLAERLQNIYKYQVDTAADGSEALHLLEEAQGRYSVALIDQVLEGEIGGLDLLKQIKSRYPDIQAIVFTGWGMEKEGANVLRQGAYRYFAKPFNLEELALTIRFAAEQRQLRREREYLSALVQVSRELTQTTDLEKQLELVWSFVQERLATATFFIALYDSETDTLRFPLSFDEGEADPLPDRHLGDDPAKWGVAGHVVRNKQELVWSSRAQAEQEWQATGIIPRVTGKGPSETGICLPLQVGEKILGTLSVQSYQPQAFDQAFLDAVRTLGSHLAPAIENARLFREIMQRTSEVETTRDHLDRLVASSFDGIITIDTNGIVTGFNAMAEKILGYKVEKVLGRPVRDLYYDPEEPRRIGKLLWQSADGKLTDHDTDVKTKRGDRIPIRLSATWLFGSQGDRIGSAGYFRDLREIQETEMHRQRLLEASKAVAQATSLEEGLQSLSRIMVESCIATFCSILLLTPDDKALIVRAAYPFPRSERLIWDPGIGKVCTPFREPRAAKMVMSDEAVILRGDRRGAKVLKHLAEEINLPGALHSVLIVPLQADERRLGVCVLGEMRAWNRSPITNRKIELAQSLANQTAIFIEKMRLYELTQQRADLLEILENLSLTISASLNLDEILKKTCQAAVELFDVDHSGLVLFDPDYVKGTATTEYPTATSTTGTVIPLQGVPLEEKLIKEREPIIIFDIENEEGLGQVREIMYGKFNIHSTVFIPVISKGKLFGSFSLDAIGHKRQFTQEEIELCGLFAAHVASAIENARSYQDARQGREYLRSLYEASSAIISPSHPQDVLQNIVDIACRATDAKRAVVLLVDESNRPRILASTGFEHALDAATSIRETGISRQVLKSGQPRFLPDTEAESKAVHPAMLAQGVRAAACLPLPLLGRNIGVLWIHFVEKHDFSETEKQSLRLYANQSAIAYDNARRMRELGQLQNAAETMAQETEWKAVLKQIASSAREILEADYTLIWPYDATRDIFFPEDLVAENVSDELLDEFRQVEPGSGRTTRKVLREGYVVVEDLDMAHGDFPPKPTRGFLNRLGVKSFQAIRLEVAGESLGVLYVDYKSPRGFGEEDRRILEYLANHASLTLKKARLYDQVQRSRQAAQIVARVSALGNLQETLKTIVAGAREVLRCDIVTLYTFDEVAQRFLICEGSGMQRRENMSPPHRISHDSSLFQIMEMADPYYFIADDAQKHRLLQGKFVKKEGIRSALGINLRLGEQRVGVMILDFRSLHRFTDDEVQDALQFAYQAAVAIRNAQQYAEIVREANLRQGLLRAGREIMALQKPEAFLQNVVNIMWDVLACDVVTLYSYDQDRGEIGFPAIVAGKLRRPGSLSKLGYVSKDSVVGQLLSSGEACFAEDAPQHPLMSSGKFVARERVESSAGIPLKSGDRVIGIVFINYRNSHLFPAQEQEALRLFATQAAIAVQNAQQFDELRRAKSLIQARTALAWMGMASSAWRHDIDRHAVTIQEELQLLRKDLGQAPSHDHYTKVDKRLSKVERLANKILEKPIVPPLSREEGVAVVALNDLVGERARQLWQNDPYRKAELQLDLQLPGLATVGASPEWLRRAFDILVDNAVEAVADREQRIITISTRVAGRGVEIWVSDTGSGMPKETQDKIGMEFIEKPEDAKGLGMGLLMARTIVQTYGGEIRVASTGPTGTTMVIWLPLEE